MIINCECQGGEISQLENGKTAVVETASKGYRGNILEPNNQNTSDEESLKFLYSVNVELKAWRKMIHKFLALFFPRLFWNWNSYAMTSQEQV